MAQRYTDWCVQFQEPLKQQCSAHCFDDLMSACLMMIYRRFSLVFRQEITSALNLTSYMVPGTCVLIIVVADLRELTIIIINTCILVHPPDAVYQSTVAWYKQRAA